MSPVVRNMKIILLICFAASLAFMTACSDSNSHSDFNPYTGHLKDWSNPKVHGVDAKAKPGSSGFASCQACHGTSFDGGISNQACAVCHGVSAPHPPKPWINGTFTHTTTHPENAPVCGSCHAAAGQIQGGNFGCFNGTLCHAQPVSHPAGWTTDHSVSARQSNTGCGTASCHGTDFSGGASGVSCYRCHLGGPDPGNGIQHPNRWADPSTSHRPYLAGLGGNASSCNPPPSPRGVNIAQYCHGVNLPDTGTGNPPPPAGIAPPNGSWGTGPTCYQCHEKEWSVP